MAAFICSFRAECFKAGFPSWAARRSPDQVPSQLQWSTAANFALPSHVSPGNETDTTAKICQVRLWLPANKESPLPGWTQKEQDVNKLWQIVDLCTLSRWCPVAQRECNLARTAYSAPESLEIMASPCNRGQANSLPCRVNLKWSFVEIQIVCDAVELHLSIRWIVFFCLSYWGKVWPQINFAHFRTAIFNSLWALMHFMNHGNTTID